MQKDLYVRKGMYTYMETKGEKEKVNFSIAREVISALRKHALESSGHSKGSSEIAERAIREYLERHGVKISNAKNEESLNPLMAQAPELVIA